MATGFTALASGFFATGFSTFLTGFGFTAFAAAAFAAATFAAAALAAASFACLVASWANLTRLSRIEASASSRSDLASSDVRRSFT